MDKRKAADRQEKRITKSLNELGLQARKQMASGSMWFAKSDVVSSIFQVEAKTKMKPSKVMSVKLEWLEKIKMEALESSKLPLLVISFGDNKDYVMMDSVDFYGMVEDYLSLKEC
jgi:hypothetical protein